MRSFLKFPASVFDSYSLQKHFGGRGHQASALGGQKLKYREMRWSSLKEDGACPLGSVFISQNPADAVEHPGTSSKAPWGQHCGHTLQWLQEEGMICRLCWAYGRNPGVTAPSRSSLLRRSPYPQLSGFLGSFSITIIHVAGPSDHICALWQHPSPSTIRLSDQLRCVSSSDHSHRSL